MVRAADDLGCDVAKAVSEILCCTDDGTRPCKG